MKNENKTEKSLKIKDKSIVCHWDSNHKHIYIIEIFGFFSLRMNPVQKNWNKRYYKCMARQLNIKILP